MRSDMGRLIIERPRYGHRDRYRLIGTRGTWDQMQTRFPLDEAPKREAIGRGGTKYFSDRLQPLFRFLDGQVGRLWDEVWSEISQVVPANGTMQIHARNHVFDYVEVHCLRGKDGRLYVGGDEPLLPLEYRWRRARLCVEPETGRLARIPLKKRTRRHVISPEVQRAAYLDGTNPYPLEDGRLLQRFKGIWYFVRFKEEWVDGKKVCVLSEKRQLSKKELRQWVPAEFRAGVRS